jgi:hypothetical protein
MLAFASQTFPKHIITLVVIFGCSQKGQADVARQLSKVTPNVGSGPSHVCLASFQWFTDVIVKRTEFLTRVKHAMPMQSPNRLVS